MTDSIKIQVLEEVPEKRNPEHYRTDPEGHEVLDVDKLLSTGWTYREINWLPSAIFDWILEVIGTPTPDHYVLARSSRRFPDSPTLMSRGQIILSPTARLLLKPITETGSPMHAVFMAKCAEFGIKEKDA